MPARKMKVEILDGSDNRYTIIFEGKVTRERVLHIFDIVELLGGVHDTGVSENGDKLSKFTKLKHIAKSQFPYSWFSSKQLLNAYEQHFEETISLSTVATYLARMAARGTIEKGGKSQRRKYRMMTRLAQKTFGFAEDRRSRLS